MILTHNNITFSGKYKDAFCTLEFAQSMDESLHKWSISPNASNIYIFDQKYKYPKEYISNSQTLKGFQISCWENMNRQILYFYDVSIRNNKKVISGISSYVRDEKHPLNYLCNK
jgi:hypothetical protein